MLQYYCNNLLWHAKLLKGTKQKLQKGIKKVTKKVTVLLKWLCGAKINFRFYALKEKGKRQKTITVKI